MLPDGIEMVVPTVWQPAKTTAADAVKNQRTPGHDLTAPEPSVFANGHLKSSIWYPSLPLFRFHFLDGAQTNRDRGEHQCNTQSWSNRAKTAPRLHTLLFSPQFVSAGRLDSSRLNSSANRPT